MHRNAHSKKLINKCSSKLTMVNKRLLHAQEIETFYAIPTIRRYLAEFMLEQGKKQKEIAELFGTTTATISQYTSKKRGNEITFGPEVIKELKEASKRIKDMHTYMFETQKILKFLRTTEIICKIHKRFGGVPSDCNADAMGCNKA